MAQAYSAEFAGIYNHSFATFARDVAPRIHDFYVSREVTRQRDRVLDLCCGTGQCARYFLDRGFAVTGVDLSEAMLGYARQNAGRHLEDGSATFVRADAASFVVEKTFGLVISTYDALNHLPDEAALRSCFTSVAKVTVEGGYFVFDLNTRLGIQRWNGISVSETGQALLIVRGIFAGGDRAQTLITGFVKEPDGRYARFDELVYNTVFEMAEVSALLAQSGWRSAYFARLDDLSTPVKDPEQESRVFVVAVRGDG